MHLDDFDLGQFQSVMALTLLALCVLSAFAADYPTPAEHTDVETKLLEQIQQKAKVASAAATPQVGLLRF